VEGQEVSQRALGVVGSRAERRKSGKFLSGSYRANAVEGKKTQPYKMLSTTFYREV